MKPFLVGVTGTIGSGKSRLLKQLAALDILVIKADDVAKKVLYTEENKVTLKSLLGETICNEDNVYDLKEIRRILFSEPTRKSALEKFARPLVLDAIEKMIKASSGLIAVIENAVLFEDGWGNYFNLIICLSCDEGEAIRRVTSSRSVTSDDVRAIMKSQMPIEEKIALSDIHIDTTSFEKNDHNATLNRLFELLKETY